jgi:hypothetical protein
MAYKVDKFNGTFLVNVSDGTIDTTTDLRFVGKNYAGYGEIQNENFLHLMENFANTTQPPKAVIGQIWYDSANKKLKFYDGNKFKFANGAESATTAPSGLSVGEFWWDSVNQQLYTWSGTDYILVGPESSPELGASSVVTAQVIDTSNVAHSVVKIISADETIAIVSRDEFTPNSAALLSPAFNVIKKGITLRNTNALGVTSDDHVYWGTASNSTRLGGRPASEYLTDPPQPFTGEVSFKDPGFSLGDDNDLRIRVENSDELIVENRLGSDITIRITVDETTDERDVAVFGRTGMFPGLTATYDLGTTSLRWNNVYAITTTSNLVGNVTGNTVGEHKGTIRANDDTVMINGASKQIGFVGANIVGTLTGSCTGSSLTSTSALTLQNFEPSIGFLLDPETSTPLPDQRSVPLRSPDGDITARRLIGIANQADQLLVGATYRSSALTATANTIAARDNNGDIFARLFQGTATSAQYADLAEKYLADAEYEPGTVVVVGGEAEVTASSWGQRALGVVSTNPAYMMNSELEGGTYIALKGRVPVKVVGAVKKGDRLVATADGCATAGVPHSSDVFAIALETNSDVLVKIIEAVVL